MTKQKFKEIEYRKSFFVNGNFDRKIIIRRWLINWRFPFIHRIIKTYTTEEWYKKTKREFGRQFNEQLFNSFLNTYEKTKDRGKQNEKPERKVLYRRYSRR